MPGWACELEGKHTTETEAYGVMSFVRAVACRCAIGQDVVEQRGPAGSEKAGQVGDGKARVDPGWRSMR
jgi:hypothetical protein